MARGPRWLGGGGFEARPPASAPTTRTTLVVWQSPAMAGMPEVIGFLKKTVLDVSVPLWDEMLFGRCSRMGVIP